MGLLKLLGLHTKEDHKYYEYKFRINWDDGWKWVDFDSFEKLHKAISYFLRKRKEIDSIEVIRVKKYHGIKYKEEEEKIAEFPFVKS